ncbi:MAG: RIO1 family regulatory kinase/ATPase [Anaerolineae bacterium]
MSRFDSYDEYDMYEEEFSRNDRQARRKRKPQVQHKPKKSQGQIVEEIADAAGLEAGFKTTYRPGLFEEGWLLDSLRGFYDQAYITDVLGLVKGGKEASVYRCEAHERLDDPLLAAKVYRPRMFRQLRNDKMYREGRKLLKENGKAAKETDHRMMRAVNKKTGFGAQVEHTSWLMHEYTTLQKLYALGAAVPEPIAAAENAILMSYCGDDGLAAPPLSEVKLPRNEVEPIFREVMRNIELMLQNGMIHGDLSAYNILYWDGGVTLIDFPQVTTSSGNSNARMILERDLTRVCEYFSAQGMKCSAQDILRSFWRRYMARNPEEIKADLSRMIEE